MSVCVKVGVEGKKKLYFVVRAYMLEKRATFLMSSGRRRVRKNTDSKLPLDGLRGAGDAFCGYCSTADCFLRKNRGLMYDLGLIECLSLCSQATEVILNDTASRSSITIRPRPEDDGRVVKCRAENPVLANSTVEDSFMLNVLCECDD